MSGLRFMLVAGEISGDQRAASLIQSLKSTTESDDIEFFGAGGSAMKEAGMDLLMDLTSHAVIGHLDAIRNYFKFRGFFNQLLDIATERKPDAIILVDYSGFNLRFAAAIQNCATGIDGWNPKIIYYVSPQLWASREGRSKTMVANVDLLLSIIPFEKQWYAQRLPHFPVEFIGHPLLDEFEGQPPVFSRRAEVPGRPNVLLLPGSRKGEVTLHLPLLLETAKELSKDKEIDFTMIVPSDELKEHCQQNGAEAHGIRLQKGGTREALLNADLALTKSGTITLECALYGVPSIVFYITNPLIYFLGRRLIKVPYLAMPNLIAKAPIFPEYIQGEATVENLAHSANLFLTDQALRQSTLDSLKEVARALGQKGGTQRAALAIQKEMKFLPAPKQS
ncbi:lipid-A-disaccharide synthase [Verrucomicrobia bacterium]|nr:lipid-A-disaccharide synthase [Verrucomicrobiota bacterium]